MIRGFRPSVLGVSILGLLLPATASPEAKTLTARVPGSTLTYTLKHPMHTVVGVHAQPQCTVALPEGAAADSVGASLSCRAAVSGFDSGNENRDSHMLETVEALDYPEVAFSGKTTERTSTGWKVSGSLTFHGTTRPLQMELRSDATNGQLRLCGSFDIRLEDFAIERPRLLFVPVAESLRVDVDLLAPSP